MKLFALSDLHVHYRENLDALAELPAHPEDWLILAGDLGDRPEHLEAAFEILLPRFRRLLWVPGNHELWTPPDTPDAPRGVARYEQMVEVCQMHGVDTPEDPWPLWKGPGGPHRIALLHLLYDYSFRPEDVAEDELLSWAAEAGLRCADERHLHPDPYPTKAAWCRARLEMSERRLEEIRDGPPLVLVNHYPLRYDQVRLGRIPRFSIWCGTRATEVWHRRYPVAVVVSGHLHVRSTDFRDGVRFEEVSLGYPPHWRRSRGVEHYLREILPGRIPPPEEQSRAPWFHR